MSERMPADGLRKGPTSRLRERLSASWDTLHESFAGLPDTALIEPGVVGDWSIKDILTHITTWEEEALKNLPIIARGGASPRYASLGGIDVFNARMADQKKGNSLAAVRRQLDETHRRLLDYIDGVPEVRLRGGTRFRRRLRLDTYGHYAEHAASIRAWRALRSSS